MTMEPISVLIIEDEDIWIRNLELSLQDFGAEVAAVARNTDEAIAAFKTCNFDVALIDIHLNNKSIGIELGKVLTAIYNKPFIFITGSQNAHDVQAAAAANPSAYLVKPVNTSSLFIALQSAIRNFTTRQQPADEQADHSSSFFVKQGSKYKKIEWKDVVYLTAGKNYLTVFNSADEREYHIRSSLQKALQYIIPQKPQVFLQVNRAEAVQESFIKEINGDKIKTAYKDFVISEAYGRDVKKRLNILA